MLLQFISIPDITISELTDENQLLEHHGFNSDKHYDYISHFHFCTAPQKNSLISLSQRLNQRYIELQLMMNIK